MLKLDLVCPTAKLVRKNVNIKTTGRASFHKASVRILVMVPVEKFAAIHTYNLPIIRS
jgi:hypothetical protein